MVTLVAAPLSAVTPLAEVRYTPQVTTILGGTTVGPADVAVDDLAGSVTVLGIGAIPRGAHLDGYAVAANGDQLLSFDTTVVLGGTTFLRADVIRYDGATYALELAGASAGVPGGVDLKDVAVTSTDLLLTFDSAFETGGTVFLPDDVGLWNGAALSKFFDGTAAGLPAGVAIDGLHRLPNGHLLFSFDTAVEIAGFTYNHEDIAEYTPGSPGLWEPAYVGAAAQPTGWGAADLSALDATAGTNAFDVDLWLSGPATVTVGAGFTYTVSLTNLGPQAATALSVALPLPTGVLFQALSPPAGWICSVPPSGSNGTVLCSSPNLTPSVPQTFAVSVSAPAAAGVLSASATVASDPADVDPSNNVATVATTVLVGQVTAPDVAIAKTATPFVAPGGTFVITLVVVNNGSGTASNVAVADPLPAGVLFQSLSAPAGWTCTTPTAGTNGTVSCTLANLAVGTPQTFVLVVTAPTTPGAPVVNSATVATNPADQSAADNSASATTQVGGASIPQLGRIGLFLLVMLIGALGVDLVRRLTARG